MQTCTAVEGQSLYDVCLNTYGSLDFLLKMLQDSGVSDINQSPHSGQVFSFDPQLVVDQGINRQLTVTNTRYATAYSKLGSVYYTVIDQGAKSIPANPYNPPPNPNQTTTMYETVGNAQYIGGNVLGETTISLPDLIGKDFVQIDKEIKHLLESEWLWNKTSGTLTLINGVVLDKDETLFILWKELITITS